MQYIFKFEIQTDELESLFRSERESNSSRPTQNLKAWGRIICLLQLTHIEIETLEIISTYAIDS